MERKTTTQDVPTVDQDVPAAGDPKRPWTKPEIRIMTVNFTGSGTTSPVPMGEGGSTPRYLPNS